MAYAIAGIDVHTRMLVVCDLAAAGEDAVERRQSTPAQLRLLADWLTPLWSPGRGTDGWKLVILRTRLRLYRRCQNPARIFREKSPIGKHVFVTTART